MPRPSTPNMLNPRAAGPSSPPQTPKSASPPLAKSGSNGPGRSRQQRGPAHPANAQMPSRRSGIHPMGNGPNFSYRPDSLRPDQLSPQSSSSSSAEESDSDSSTSDSPPRSVSSQHSRKSTAQQQPRLRPMQDRQAAPRSPSPAVSQMKPAPIIIVESTSIEVVELPADFDYSEDEGCTVMRPYLIEYAESDRSRSRSRNPGADLDRKIVSDLRDLAFPSSGEESDLDEDDYEKLLRRQCEERRRKRMSFGSFSKRTISERGSDSDREDLANGGIPLDPTETAANRRLRRRVGNRHSLQFQDPPPPRIDECDEPDSSEEILDDEDGLLLARELPYYDYISMEVDSP